MALTPAERARNYRRRKAEERKAARETLGITPGPSRQKRRDKARSDRVRRAAAILEQPVPPRATLLDEGLRILRSVGLDPGASENARVSAGKSLIEWASGSNESAVAGILSSPQCVSVDERPIATPTLDDLFAEGPEGPPDGAPPGPGPEGAH